jgi:uncharacterized RDD family membrane protein YckC
MFTILGADGKEYGPVSADKVQEWIKGRRADLRTKARREGETEWKTLGDFPELAPAPAVAPAVPAAGAPPPPPPGPITIASMMGTPARDPIVPAELELAGRGARLLAQIVDGLAGCVVALPGAALLIMGGGGKNSMLALTGMGLLGVGVLALLIVQIYLLTTRGQTVGKKLLNVKIVVEADDTNPGFVKAFLLRVLVNAIIGAIPLVGFLYTIVDICFIFRGDRRCIHDLLAGTKVVKA